MAEHVIKLPDVGEGVAEAELVEWHVKVGDLVREDTMLGAVMTDKATVEIPSPVEGEVVWLGAEVGDVVAVGSDLVRLKVAGDDKSSHRQARRRRRERRPAAGTVRALVPATPPDRRCRARVPPAPPCQSAPHTRATARPDPPRASCAERAASRRRETLGLAGGSSPGARGRNRPAPGPRHRPGGPHHPRGSRRLPRAGSRQAPRHPASRRGRLSRTSRSSACAAGSPRRCRSPTRASRTSPMSRRSMSPRSRSCARRSTRRNGRTSRS